MKIGAGVEWCVHACTLLAVLPANRALNAEALAEYFDVPPAYLAKQMQALSKAGLVISHRGSSGGYQLSRPAEEISLWDITEAVEGAKPSFRCQEIRQGGPCGARPEECRRPCGVAASFYAAETAFRDYLRDVSLASIIVDAASSYAQDRQEDFAVWLEANASRLS